LEGQVTTVIAQASSESCDREGLAGGSSNKKVNWVIFVALDGREVPMQGDIGIVVGQHGAGKSLNLGEEGGLPAKMVPSCCRGFNARANATVSHIFD
jgi:hypothetical protein